MSKSNADEVERLMKLKYPDYGSEWIYGHFSALHKAVMVFDDKTETVVEGDLYLLRKLIAEGTNLEMKDEYGQTPLLLASSNGLINVVRLLLESGANVNAENEIGQTSYQAAVEYGYTETADLLQRHGAGTEAVERD